MTKIFGVPVQFPDINIKFIFADINIKFIFGRDKWKLNFWFMVKLALVIIGIEFKLMLLISYFLYFELGIHAAAKAGAIDKLKQCVGSGEDINKKSDDEPHCTPLMYAVEKGDLQCVEFLLQNGANVEEEDSQNERAIHKAAQRGDVLCLQLLTKYNASIEARVYSYEYPKYGGTKYTPLHYASINGHVSCVKLLIQKAAVIDGIDPRHGICFIDAFIDAQDHIYMTALMHAVDNGNVGCAEVLLENKANVEIWDNCAETALYKAAKKGDLPCLEVLIKYKADVNTTRRATSVGIIGHPRIFSCGIGDFSIPLHQSARHGHYDCVELLLRNDARVNATDMHDATPLHWACRSGQASCIKLLIQNGADIHAICKDLEKGKNNLTGLHIAAEEGHVPCIDILLEHGADSDAEDSAGKTPLSIAVSSLNENLNTTTNDEKHETEHMNFLEAVEILLEYSKYSCIPKTMLPEKLQQNKIPLPDKAENIYETLKAGWCQLDVASMFLLFETNLKRRLIFKSFCSTLQQHGYKREGKEYINAAMFSMNEMKTARIVITSMNSKPRRIKLAMFYPNAPGIPISNVYTCLPKAQHALLEAVQLEGESEVSAKINPCFTEDEECDIRCFLSCTDQMLPSGEFTLASCPVHHEFFLPEKIAPWFERRQPTSGCIDSTDISKIASGVGPNDLQAIARQYLNIPECDIETYEASMRGDVKRLKFKILAHWRNQNPGPDARKKLFDKLELARKEHGLIDISCYKFLVEDPN